MLLRLLGFFLTFISLFILYTKKALFFEPLLNDQNLLNVFIYLGMVIFVLELGRIFWLWKSNRSFGVQGSQFLVWGISFYFYLGFYASADINYPQVNFVVLLYLGLALTVLSSLSEAAFFYCLLLAAFFIFLTEFQLGYHAESSSFKPVIHAALFILSWNIFIKEKVFGKNSQVIFMICLSFVIGIYYFFPAISKMRISPHLYEWALFDDLENLLPAMCLYGWANSCSWNQWPQWILNSFGLAAIVVLVFELVSVFILSGISLTLLAGLRAIFHLIIFYIGGDIFAGLVFLNIYLIFLSYSLRKESVRPILNAKLASFFLVFFGATLVFRFPIDLGWYDTRISQKYVVSLVDRDDKVYKVDYSFWDHYMTNFVYADFSYLLAKTTHPVLTSGTSDTNQLPAFLMQKNLKDTQEFLQQRQSLAEMMKVEIWDNSKTLEFVRKYIIEKCVKKNSKTSRPLLLRQYHHSMARVSSDFFISDCQDLDIIEFRIHMEESFFNGQGMDQTARVQVYEETFY